MLIRTVIEIIVVGCLIAGIFNEQRIADLERRILSGLRRRRRERGSCEQ